MRVGIAPTEPLRTNQTSKKSARPQRGSWTACCRIGNRCKRSYNNRKYITHGGHEESVWTSLDHPNGNQTWQAGKSPIHCSGKFIYKWRCSSHLRLPEGMSQWVRSVFTCCNLEIPSMCWWTTMEILNAWFLVASKIQTKIDSSASKGKPVTWFLKLVPKKVEIRPCFHVSFRHRRVNSWFNHETWPKRHREQKKNRWCHGCPLGQVAMCWQHIIPE